MAAEQGALLAIADGDLQIDVRSTTEVDKYGNRVLRVAIRYPA